MIDAKDVKLEIEDSKDDYVDLTIDSRTDLKEKEKEKERVRKRQTNFVSEKERQTKRERERKN